MLTSYSALIALPRKFRTMRGLNVAKRGSSCANFGIVLGSIFGGNPSPSSAVGVLPTPGSSPPTSATQPASATATNHTIDSCGPIGDRLLVLHPLGLRIASIIAASSALGSAPSTRLHRAL